MDRTQLAKDIKNNPIFQESFDQLKEQLLNDWKNTTVHATTDREQLWLEMRLVDRVYNHIVTVLDDGKMYEHTLNLKEI
jgi:hypothetical protein